jgi:hypothetical protein
MSAASVSTSKRAPELRRRDSISACRVGGPQIGAAHGISICRPGAAALKVVADERGAQCAARVAGGRLDQIRSKQPSRRTLPFATQFSATPPARHRFLMPVSLRSDRVSASTTSSVTAWMEAARSMWNSVSGSSGLRGGAPNRALNRPLVIVRPVQ